MEWVIFGARLTAVQLLLSGTPEAIWRQSRGQADVWELHQYSVMDVSITFGSGIWIEGLLVAACMDQTYDAC